MNHTDTTTADLKRRETVTEAMLRQIDEKLARLGSARTQRVRALQQIRVELTRSIGGSVGPDQHEAQ